MVLTKGERGRTPSRITKASSVQTAPKRNTALKLSANAFLACRCTSTGSSFTTRELCRILKMSCEH